MTGIGPTDAMDRSEALLHTSRNVYVPASKIAQDNYSGIFLARIDHAMFFKTDGRPQLITEWRNEITNIHINSEFVTVAVDNIFVSENEEKTIRLETNEENNKNLDFFQGN